MDRATWTNVREYVQAEVKLAIAQHIMGRLRDKLNTDTPGLGPAIAEQRRTIDALQEQVTRMETAVREALPEMPPKKERAE
jgi:hypothetical protein